MKSLRSIVLTALLAPATLAACQGPAQPARRITLDVVVEDKLGHPVPGLQQQDFTVLDNGQARTLADFDELDGGGQTDSTRIVVIVDMINVDFNTVAREREQLGEFLHQEGGRLGHPLSIGVMTESGVKIMKNSSSDGQVLLSEFEKFQTALRPVGRSAGFYGAAERLEKSIGQLAEIAAYAGTVPGRKLVLVISPGWPLLSEAGIQEDEKQRTWTYNTIVQLTNGLREAHVALYCLDPFDLGRTNPYYYQGYLKGVSKADKAEYPDLGLQVLAEHTGGRTLVTGRDILDEIRTAVRDAGPYYELSFEALAPEHPGEYHELRVKTDKPDVTVRTSASYYTEAAAPGGNPPPIAKPLGK